MNDHVRMSHIKLTVVLLILFATPCFCGRKRNNIVPSRDLVNNPLTTRYPIPSKGNMEDIVDSPPFRYRDVAEDPNVWTEALSAYDKLLSKSPKQTEPKVDPFRNLQPGLFVPWAYGSDSSGTADALLAEKNEEVVHHHDYNDDDEEAKKARVAKIAPRGNHKTEKDDGDLIQVGSVTDSGPSSGSAMSQGRTTPCSYVEIGEVTNLTATTPDPGNMNSNTTGIENITEIILEQRLMKNGNMTQEDLYGNCGTPNGKTCYGIPSGCIKRKYCRLIVTLQNETRTRIKVNLAGESAYNGFVAFAFSKDRFVGDDIIMYCINVPKTTYPELEVPRVALFLSYTNKNAVSYMQKNKTLHKKNFCPYFGYSSSPRILACSFGLSTTIFMDDETSVNLMENSYYIMLAFGHYHNDLSVTNPDYGALKYNHLLQFSAEPVILNRTFENPENIEPRGLGLIIVHIICSAFAFIFLIPTAMFFSKYGREVLGYNQRIFGRYQTPAWLWAHIRLNVLSIPLILISLIVIMIELDFQWRSERPYPRFHSITGAVAMGLAIINLGLGFLFKIDHSKSKSPKDNEHESKSMKVLTWAHWLIGNLTYFMAISSMFVVGSLSSAQAPCFLEYFSYLHLTVHVITHIVMAIDTRNMVREIDKNRHWYQRVLIGPMIPFSAFEKKFKTFIDSSGVTPFRGRRRVLLFYFLISFICAFAISVLMVLPTVLCR